MASGAGHHRKPSVAPDIAAAPRLADCHACGTLQRAPLLPARAVLCCVLCHAALQRSHGRSAAGALACAAAALLLLIPANLLPFLTTAIAGASQQSRLVSSAGAMLADGFPELALAVGLFVVVAPIVRCGLLAAVLGALHLGRRPRWLGRAFRAANALQLWAMADVFLLGSVIATARLKTVIAVEIGPGALCFGAAALLMLLTRALLDTGATWRAIAADRNPPENGPVLACSGCGLLLPAARAGGRCPRCAARLHARKPGSVSRAAALTLAAAVLYVPANVYPFATVPLGLASVQYNVLEGVVDLAGAGLYGLALLVLTASFVIPLLKIAVLAWCIASVLRSSPRHLVTKTRSIRGVDEIGRWSMVDPFVIACFVPVTRYDGLLHGSAEPAAPLFAAVVILTTLAARSFDPRLLWDRALPQRTS
jgi:paraquat-inducible protein A